MKKYVLMLALGLSSTMAIAGTDTAPKAEAAPQCKAYGQDEVMTQEHLATRLDAAGYKVDNISAKQNCYDVQAVGPDGKPVHLSLDMKTGEIVQ